MVFYLFPGISVNKESDSRPSSSLGSIVSLPGCNYDIPLAIRRRESKIISTVSRPIGAGMKSPCCFNFDCVPIDSSALNGEKSRRIALRQSSLKHDPDLNSKLSIIMFKAKSRGIRLEVRDKVSVSKPKPKPCFIVVTRGRLLEERICRKV